MRLPQASSGGLVNNAPTGFPLFFNKREPRIVTADAWSVFEHVVTNQLDGKRKSTALSYVEQAFDFYEAARSTEIVSKPLLYYYSFLNLIKTALLIRKVHFAARPKHGISDPLSNERTRLRMEGQTIRIPAAASNRSELFPEFIRILGGGASRSRNIKVLDIFAQIPSIHRTFVRITKRPVLFLPVKCFEVRRNQKGIWARVIVRKNDEDVKTTLSNLKKRTKFRQCLHQKDTENQDEIWLETDFEVGERRAVDSAIKRLALRLCALGVSSILDSAGYRFYFCNLDPKRRLPSLAAAYAAFFYLGSVTRYKPDVFEKILSGKFGWIIWELIGTQPVQFLYTLASELIGVDVVRPYAAIQ